MSPTSKFCHQHPQIVAYFKLPTSLSPIDRNDFTFKIAIEKMKPKIKNIGKEQWPPIKMALLLLREMQIMKVRWNITIQD